MATLSLSITRIRLDTRRTRFASFQRNSMTVAVRRFCSTFGEDSVLTLSERQRELVERKLALKAIGWSVDPFDWQDPGPAVVTDRILRGWAESPGVFHGAIILCHDIHAGTMEAMPKTLAALKDQGYRFLTIDELRAFERGVGDWPMAPREESTV